VSEVWLTVAEVADRLKVHPNTVRRWIKEKRLMAKMIGGTKTGWRISQREVDRFMEVAPEGEHREAGTESRVPIVARQ